MTEQESREWFGYMSHVGMDGKLYATTMTCPHWEQMYQAFKARMMADFDRRYMQPMPAGDFKELMDKLADDLGAKK